MSHSALAGELITSVEIWGGDPNFNNGGEGAYTHVDGLTIKTSFKREATLGKTWSNSDGGGGHNWGYTTMKPGGVMSE